MSSTFTVNQRIALAEAHVAGRTLLQQFWRKQDAHDRECACLLGAFGRDINDPANCPVELMPEWLARLIPLVNDGLPSVFYYDFAGDFVGSAHRWSKLSGSEWSSIHKALITEITWYANAMVEEGDQEAGRVFRDNQPARQRLDALLIAARAIPPAVFDTPRVKAAGNAARDVFNAEHKLHVGLGGRERRVVMAAQHAAHAAYRAADGSVADAACYMAKVASLVDVDRAPGNAWRHVAAVLMRLLGKEAVQ